MWWRSQRVLGSLDRKTTRSQRFLHRFRVVFDHFFAQRLSFFGVCQAGLKGALSGSSKVRRFDLQHLRPHLLRVANSQYPVEKVAVVNHWKRANLKSQRNGAERRGQDVHGNHVDKNEGTVTNSGVIKLGGEATRPSSSTKTFETKPTLQTDQPPKPSAR